MKRTGLKTAPERRVKTGEKNQIAPALAVEEGDVFGWTPLMAAVWNNKEETARKLLPSADTRRRDKQGRTLLMYAAMSRSGECARLLLAESDPKASDEDGETALTIAVANYSVACVKLLLPVSDALAANAKGETALDVAVVRDSWGCAALLAPYYPLARVRQLVEEAPEHAAKELRPCLALIEREELKAALEAAGANEKMIEENKSANSARFSGPKRV